MGIGDWPNPQSPIPNPQSPIPNPHINLLIFDYILNYLFFYNYFYYLCNLSK